MSEPVTFVVGAAWGLVASALQNSAASAIVGGVVGNRADALFCKVMHASAKRLQALPKNHDVVGGIIHAHRMALKYYADTLTSQASNFSENQIASKVNRAVKTDAAVAGADKLEELLEPLLSNEGASNPDARLHKIVESCVQRIVVWLEESIGEPLPSRFKDYLVLRAPNGRLPWLTVFRDHIAEEIKTNDRFSGIFLAGAVSKILNHAITVEQLSGQILGELSALHETIGRIQEDASQTKELLEQLSTRIESGLGEAVTQTWLKRLYEFVFDESAVDIHTAQGRIDDWIRAARPLVSPEASPVGAALRAAWDRIQIGDSKSAAEPLADLLARQEAMAKKEQGEILEKMIEVNLVALQFSNVPPLVAKAVTVLVGENHSERMTEFLRRAAEANERADSQSDRLQRRLAIEVLRAALAECQENEVLGRAELNRQTADALYKLGMVEFGPTHIREAVVAYRRALDGWTRERDPERWAAIKNNCGAALVELGRRARNPKHIEEALIEYRDALQVRTKARVPLEWAGTQGNLGNALSELGGMTGQDFSGEAQVALRSALEVIDERRNPVDWAVATANLGIALLNLHRDTGDEHQLSASVSKLRSALQRLPKSTDALRLSRIRLNLGSALRAIGVRDKNVSALEESLEEHRLALLITSRSSAPGVWAEMQFSRADVLSDLGRVTTKVSWVLDALEAYKLALEEIPEKSEPLKWADVQVGVGRAHQWIVAHELLSSQNLDEERVFEALAAYRKARNVFERRSRFADWEGALSAITALVVTLGRCGIDGGLDETVSDLRNARKRFQECGVIALAASTAQLLGDALICRGVRKTDSFYFEEARDAYQAADSHFSEAGEYARSAEARLGYGLANAHLGGSTSEMGKILEAESLVIKIRDEAQERKVGDVVEQAESVLDDIRALMAGF